MSLLKDIFAGSAGKFLDQAGNLADRFITTGDDKREFMLSMETLLQKRDSELEQTLRTEITAKSNIMIAEMQHGNNYTKNARPTVVYFGLFAIFFNYMLVPFLQTLASITVAPFELPTEFWVAWGGVVGIYSLGRSAEKGGLANKGTRMLTGSIKGLDL